MFGFTPISDKPISDVGVVAPTASLSGAILESHDGVTAVDVVTSTLSGAIHESHDGTSASGGAAFTYTTSFTFQPTDIKPAPITIDFTDTSTVSPGGSDTKIAWSWTFGDGGSSTLQNPTHRFNASGFYTVALIVTWAIGGPQGPVTHVVTVNPPIPFVPTPPAAPPVIDVEGYFLRIIPEHNNSQVRPLPTPNFSLSRASEGRDTVAATASGSTSASAAAHEGHDIVAAQASHS